MKTTKKFLSVFLSVIMAISIIPMSGIIASAATDSGTCGENSTWSYDESTYTLTISGTGVMALPTDGSTPWDGYKSDVKKVVIKEGITGIFGFANCRNLKIVEIPNTVLYIWDEAFYNCYRLSNVVIPDSVIRIGYRAFYGCKSITNMTIPEGVKTLDPGVFIECSSLEQITILGNIDEIPYMGFLRCSSLKNISIPSTVTSIGQYAFTDCVNLEKVLLGTNVSVINPQAFDGCTNLKEIVIPDTMVTIRERAFLNCNNLTDVYYGGTEEFWKLIVIEGYNASLTNAELHYNYCYHTFGEYEIIKFETCTEDGLKKRICSQCEYEETMVITRLGHDYGAYIVDIQPTCVKEGSKSNHCSRCDSTINITQIPATGHSYTVKITTPATHLTEGVMTYTCDCGDSYTETIAKITEHTYVEMVTPPTCEDKGYTTYTCECGDSYVGDYADVLGHTPASAVEENYVSPTCTENGSKDVVVYCSVCDEEISRETVTLDALGHADNDGNGYCDDCEELLDPTVECECNCHKSGISKFFFNLILFFQRLFGANKECACGVAHY